MPVIDLTKFKVGDIVKFTTKEGKGVVGILYENGNKMPGSFRVVTLGQNKYRFLHEPDLEKATKAELETYIKSATLTPLTPEAVIAKETEEAGGKLPSPIPVNGTDKSEGDDDGGEPE